MKKIEITKLIDEKLVKNPLIFNDLLNKTNSINSYEKFIQEFSLMKKTFKDNISEFYDETIKYIEKMSRFIDSCADIEDNKIQEYINNNIKNAIYGCNTSQVNIKSIFIKNLSNTTERCESTIIQIYNELGYDNLVNYIQLLKSPNLLTSYLNDSEKQIVAMHYLLYKTNHHSTTKFSRNLATANLYNHMETNINESIQEIIDEKSDYITFMNSEKDKYNEWFEESNSNLNKLYDDSKKEYDEFMLESRKKINQLEQTYSAKLKIKEPSNYMLEKSKEYTSKAIKWGLTTIGLSIILILLFGMILNPEIKINNKLIVINLFSGEMPIYSSILILAIIYLIIYVIRVFIKLTISSKHLSEEYYQKHILTYFYLSLLNDGKLDEKTGNIILSSLFAKADTGLIKNDTTNESDNIMKLLTSMRK